MIIHYPTIYQTVGDYCNHLFLVIGNGYEWNSGELVAISGSKKRQKDGSWIGPEDPHFRNEEAELAAEKSECLHNYLRLDIRRHNHQVQFVLDNFDLIFDESIELTQPYPLSGYSKLSSFPEDVAEDWFEAMVKTVYALRAWCNGRELDRTNIIKTLSVLIDEKYPIIQERKAAAIRFLQTNT
jgi:hypothetical protein